MYISGSAFLTILAVIFICDYIRACREDKKDKKEEKKREESREREKAAVVRANDRFNEKQRSEGKSFHPQLGWMDDEDF